ncbi:MAG: hypothetical protein AABW63_00455 [Nanoarchaeota archaeon]
MKKVLVKIVQISAMEALGLGTECGAKSERISVWDVFGLKNDFSVDAVAIFPPVFIKVQGVPEAIYFDRTHDLNNNYFPEKKRSLY